MNLDDAQAAVTRAAKFQEELDKAGFGEPPDPEITKLREALVSSLRLQSHYAALLNMHDGGRRQIFKSVEEWLDRLESLKVVR